MYAKDLSKSKYQFLIKKREEAKMYLDDPKVFIEYSNTMDDVYNNIDDYNPNRERKIWIFFDEMIADVMANKKFQAIIKELFIRRRKLIICLVLIHNLIFLFQKKLD